MKIIDLLTKYKGLNILKPYYSVFSLLTPPLDKDGTAIKEWLFRAKKIRYGSEFFRDFTDEDLRAIIDELQDLSHKSEYNSTQNEDEKALSRAFRRSIRKIQKSGSNFL